MIGTKEQFLRNEFLTMSVFGALGRSRTYPKSATEEAKRSFRNFRNALRKKLDEVSSRYESTVEEEEHLANIKDLSDDLSSRFCQCLDKGRFRLGIAQKALNLYLKYLWCAGFIPTPPHCPFDSVVINYISDCRDLKWTSIDNLQDYLRLVEAARKKADGKSIAEWELEIWLNSVQSVRERKGAKRLNAEKEQVKKAGEAFQLSSNSISGDIIIGTVIRPHANRSDCEIIIRKSDISGLPHEYRQKTLIDLTIGKICYEAGVHETKAGVVWISSVLYKREPRREQARLVDALAEIGLQNGDKVNINKNPDGTYSLK